MTLLPRSLFGRLLLLLLSGLVLAQLLSAAIQLHDRGQVLRRTIGLHVARRIGAIVTLLDTLPEAEQRRLVQALDLPPTRISLDVAWGALPTSESRYAEPFAALLRRHLPAGRALQVAVSAARMRRPRHPEHEPPPWHGPRWREQTRRLRVKDFQAQVALKNGGVVTFRHRLPEDVFAWPYRLLATLAILLTSVALLSMLAVRWLTHPLTWLATAATELGRDIQRPPLPETGPLEVRRAARAFNTMQTRLRRYIDDRSRVLAAVSHDLKTPLTRLRLRTELLDDETLQAKFRADLDDMEAMVQATLVFMRGTEQRETVVPVDINALLESLQEDLTDAGGEMHLQGAANAPFPGRPLALKRCLNNVLDNAVRYGQRAWVRVSDTPEQLTITLRDAGPGIPEAELERVFEPFYRLESSRSRHSGGTGLGLGIARNIARAHGGELRLQNGAERGLEVMLELPR